MSDNIFQIIIGPWHIKLKLNYKIEISKNIHYEEFKHEVSFIRVCK